MCFIFLGCGNKEAAGEELLEQEARTLEDISVIKSGPISLNTAVESNPLWFKVNDYPERNIEIHSIHYYNDGQLKVFPLENGSIPPSEYGKSVTLEVLLE